MSKLRKTTLDYNSKSNQWELREDKTDKLIKTFDMKARATAAGVLKKALGPDGGSVKIKKLDDKYQEERTYPRSKDPKSSEG